MEGWISLYRKLLDSEIMRKPPLYLKVWIWLLLKAQHSDYGNLKRGQLFTSIPEIQDAMTYNVGYRKEKPSKKQIWDILEWLRNPYEGTTKETMAVPMIETTKVTHGLIITIVKYGVYQGNQESEGNSESNDEGTAKERRKERQGNNINNNDNNDNNDNKNIYKNTPKKIHYAEFVTMTEEEYNKLVDKYGEENTQKMIEKLDNYKGAKGKTYKSDYRAILNWVVDEIMKEQKTKDDYKPKLLTDVLNEKYGI